MKDFIDHLEGRGYASNTINLYVYAITQLSERVPKVTNQALLVNERTQNRLLTVTWE